MPSPPTVILDSSDIRSFFSTKTAPSTQQDKPTSTSSSRPNSHRNRGISQTARRMMMTQLTLDLSTRPTTQICQDCGMSFVLGVEEDVELHKKHHRWVIDGVEWPTSLLSSDSSLAADSCRVVWRKPGGMDDDDEKIVKLSLDPQALRRSRYKHQVEQILEMVNRSLDAQELSQDQLRASSLYVYLGYPLDRSSSDDRPPKRRRVSNLNVMKNEKKKKKRAMVVKAMCVAARIETGYRIVGGVDDNDLDDRELLRFGETRSELYCSPKPENTLVGIHRIWSSPKYRRCGLSRILLDVVASTFIYGMAIVGLDARQESIAFSQPTESGMRLAADWFQTKFFKIFID